jgi:hypothetical protein
MHLYGHTVYTGKGKQTGVAGFKGWGGGGTGRRRTEGREATVRFWQSGWLDLPPKSANSSSRETVGMFSQEMFSIMKQKFCHMMMYSIFIADKSDK